MISDLRAVKAKNISDFRMQEVQNLQPCCQLCAKFLHLNTFKCSFMDPKRIGANLVFVAAGTNFYHSE